MAPKRFHGLAVYTPVVRSGQSSVAPTRLVADPVPSATSAIAVRAVRRSRSRSPRDRQFAGLPLLAKRKDAPFIRENQNRGSLALALEACRSSESRQQALDTYEARTRAESSHSSVKSLWKTWQAIHNEWYGHDDIDHPVLPLTPDSIKAVSAALIKGNYRSVANYISVAKDEHTRRFEWTSMLAREQRKANAAGSRGLGPSHQTAEMPVPQAFVAARTTSESPTDPVGTANMVACASFYILREIEVSLLLHRCVTLDLHREQVSLLLPASKTDPAAHSTTRTWGCVCEGDLTIACPFHSLKQQLELLRRTFGDPDGQLPSDLPLFPDRDGNTMTKENMVKLVERLAHECRLETTATDGRPAFGGHVWRLSGARHLSRIGVPTHIIKLLARWASDVIDHYLQDVPLELLTSAYKRGMGELMNPQALHPTALDKAVPCLTASASSSSSAPSQPNAPANMDAVKKLIADAVRNLACQQQALQAKVDNIALDSAQCRKNIEILEKRTLKPYVCNDAGSGAYHLCTADYTLLVPDFWTTRCGWAYGRARYARYDRIPKVPRSRVCKRCIPDPVATDMGIIFDE